MNKSLPSFYLNLLAQTSMHSRSVRLPPPILCFSQATLTGHHLPLPPCRLLGAHASVSYGPAIRNPGGVRELFPLSLMLASLPHAPCNDFFPPRLCPRAGNLPSHAVPDCLPREGTLFHAASRPFPSATGTMRISRLLQRKTHFIYCPISLLFMIPLLKTYQYIRLRGLRK